AAVIGPVPDGEGLLGIANATYSIHYGACVTGIPGGRWYDGKPRIYVPDLESLRMQFMNMPDEARDVVDTALGQAGRKREDVDFFACHQATPWMNQVLRDNAGLTNAKILNTFTQTASIS